MKLLFVTLFWVNYFFLLAHAPDSLIQRMNTASESQKLDILLQLSDEFAYSEPDSSHLFALQAKELARLINDEHRLAEALQRLGDAYRMKGIYDSAFQLHEEALSIWRQAGDSLKVAGALNNIGIIYDEKGINDKAIAFYLQALRIYEESDELSGMAKVYNNLGIVNKKEGNYTKVLDYYERALEIYQQLDHHMGAAITNGNIGAVHLKLKNFDEAISFSQVAIDKYKAHNLDQFIPYSLENIGLACLEKGELDLAEEYSKKALELYMRYGNLKEASFSRGTLAEIYLKLNLFDLAEEYASKGSRIAQEIGVIDEQLRSLEILYKLEKRQGDFEKALDYFESLALLKDSVMNKVKIRTVEELQVKYETEKREQELKILKAESALHQMKLTEIRNLVIFIISMCIVTLLIIILYHSRKGYKLRAQLAEEKEKLQKTRFKAVIDAEEQERKRIARELHDGLGQLLSTARLTVSSLDEEDEDPKVQNSLKLIDSAVHEVRNISHNMMPNALAAYGLESALKDLVRKINESGKVDVRMKKDVSLEFEESVSVAVYRVVQEIFNNAIKYAQATKITFLLTEKDGEVSISIKDDGKGFDTALLKDSSGIGWSNMQSRMELIGGRISVFSRLDHGTTVKVHIPSGRGQGSIAI